MASVFIAARAGTDENAAAPSATVAGPNSASLRVIVMGTSLSCETPPEAWRAFEGKSSGKVAPDRPASAALRTSCCAAANRPPGRGADIFHDANRDLLLRLFEVSQVGCG